jgi:hypothetical protein
VSPTDKPAYTVAEVALLMGYSRCTVIALFEKEPNVLVIERPEARTKRRYRSIRIPRAEYQRVVKRLTQ